MQFFDAVNEWADIISFLGRLLRVGNHFVCFIYQMIWSRHTSWSLTISTCQSFQAYPQYPVIPRKMTVAKRLAQCLNPGFPAGVHQKTLEVYAYIFETINVSWDHQLCKNANGKATRILIIFRLHPRSLTNWSRICHYGQLVYFPLYNMLPPTLRYGGHQSLHN